MSKAIDTTKEEAVSAVAKEDFAAAMRAMAKLRPHVDAFFDKVTVNVADGPDKEKLRENRLKLLNEIRDATRYSFLFPVWSLLPAFLSSTPQPDCTSGRVWSLCLEASGFTLEQRDSAATGSACFSEFRSCTCPQHISARKATAGERSSIYLPEHDIERADDRRDIGKHVPAA